MSGNIRSLAARFEQTPQQPSYTHPSIATGVDVQKLRQSYEVPTQRQTPPPPVLDRLFRDSFFPRNIASFLDRVSLLQLKKSAPRYNRIIRQMDRNTRALHSLFSEVAPKGRPYPQDIVRLIGSSLSDVDRFCLRAVRTRIPMTAGESALCLALASPENPAQALDKAILLLKTIERRPNGLVSEEGISLFNQTEIPEGRDREAMQGRVTWLHNICTPNLETGDRKKTSLLISKLIRFFCCDYLPGDEEIIRRLLNMQRLEPSDTFTVLNLLNDTLLDEDLALGLLEHCEYGSQLSIVDNLKRSAIARRMMSTKDAQGLRWTKIFLNILDPEATIFDTQATSSLERQSLLGRLPIPTIPLKRQLLELFVARRHYPELFQYLTQRYRVSVMQHETHVTLFSSVQETPQGKVVEYLCFPITTSSTFVLSSVGTLHLPTPFNLQEIINMNPAAAGLCFLNSPSLLQHFIRLNNHHLTPTMLRDTADALSTTAPGSLTSVAMVMPNFITTLRKETERMEKERSQ